jgi:GT2 family glycosyltransferase
MNYNLFILGYGSSKFLDAWIDPLQFKNTTIRIVDNGQQQYSNRLQPYIYHVSSRNLGCAGGWNLICQIAFDQLNLEKVIISNEDNLYSEEYIEALYKQCTPSNIAGTYDRAFEFSLFCIHRDTYKTVGMFDENVIMAAGEDNDYKYRCQLHGVTITSLNISADYNASETGGDSIPDIRDENIRYVTNKWSNYNSLTAHGDSKYNNHPELYISERLKTLYQTEQFPSIIEFNSLIKYENNL